MASSTYPPSGGGTSDPVSNLYLSDTFYTWFNVSNDLINKVNPIELYSITADVRDYTGAVQADGITLDDLGFGNFRIGYILPANITGGHTFHQDINFAAGVSGALVNSVNGRTGYVDAIQTISGRTASFSGFTGNVEGAVFSINGVTASTAGAMTLDIGLPITGGVGTILAATGAAGGTFQRRVEFFTTIPEEDQPGLRVRGTSGNCSVVIAGTTVDYGNFALWVRGNNTNSTSSADTGSIRTSTDTNDAYDIKTDGVGAFAAGSTLYIVSGLDSSNASTVFRHSGGNGYTAASSSMSDLLKVDNEGVVLVGKVKDKDGNLPSNGDLLIANSNGKLVYGGLANNFVKNINSSLFTGAGTTNFWLGESSISSSSQLVPTSWKGRTVVFHINIDSIHSADTGSSEQIYVSSQNSTSAVSPSSANLVFSSSTLMSGGSSQESFFHTLTFLIDVGTGANETVQIAWVRSGCDSGRTSNLRSYGWHLL